MATRAKKTQESKVKDKKNVQESEKEIDFPAIEKKWQEKWEKEKVFEVKEGKGKKKYYVLEMYPYPSSSGLHMGHAFNYTLGDIFARFKIMQGFNVLHPMGYDSFGLPAENAAIKANSHPKIFTDDAIVNFIRQQKALGLSYDWSRKLESHDTNYYKWNQYFFLQFLKEGLAYRKKAAVNFCSKCNTVLANEQVHQGKCWRHKDTEVEIRNLEQWFLKTTKYADELLEKVKDLDWPNRIKTMQENWIGKSEGVDIFFPLENSKSELSTFTTRCDTIFSVTFLAIAPESPLVDELTRGSKYEKDVKAFVKKAIKEKAEDRMNEEKEKEGIFTGKYAINPATKEKIPIYVSNFAVMYGTGVVMCDAHDKRDFRFARKYKIPLRFVISKDGKPIDPGDFNDAFVDDGILFNSGQFSGMNNREALPKMADWLESKKMGKKVVNYKLRDWLLSRQRYWGTPIPVVYCDKCGIVPVSEKDLPVLLPEKVKFGEGNPLGTNKEFVNTECPKCGGKGRRETDTMDTFMDSSWYYLRFTDSQNGKEPFDKKKVEYWMPVDFYTGGAEHACMHLIYARFFTKVLRDMGYLKFDEPFVKLFNQGMVHGEDGVVMSKSRGNVIDPLEISKKYGADTLRLFLVSMASPDKDSMWSSTGIESLGKFMIKTFNLLNNIKIGKTSEKMEHKINKTIKEVTQYIVNLEYNLAVIRIRALIDSLEEEMNKEDLFKIIKLIAPFCPHVAEELWNERGGKGFVSLASWPEYDEKKINDKYEEAERAFDKTVSDIANIIRIVKEKEGKEPESVYLYVLPNEKGNYNAEMLGKKTGKKVSVFAVNDKAKYDPEGKAGKAKPGKPGIFVE